MGSPFTFCILNSVRLTPCLLDLLFHLVVPSLVDDTLLDLVIVLTYVLGVGQPVLSLLLPGMYLSPKFGMRSHAEAHKN